MDIGIQYDAAYKKSREFGDKIPIGVLYKVEKPTYDDSFEFLQQIKIFKEYQEMQISMLKS